MINNNNKIKRTLILDDDSVSRLICKSLVTSNSQAFCFATSKPKLALKGLNKGIFDRIILDLDMPEINGIEFILRLREMNFQGGLILISFHDIRILESARDLALSCKLNVLDIIRKPVTSAAIKKALSNTVVNSASPVSNSHEKIASHLVNNKEIQSELNSVTESLVLAFQPKYSMETEKISSVEVLSRWKIQGVLLSPDRFLSTAYASDLIHDLSLLIYKRALDGLQQLHNKGFMLSISVNFSMASLARPGFVEELYNIAYINGIDMNYIIIELTENQGYGSIQHYLEKIMFLVFKRFKVSLDDFGTGQSTLEHLRHIPFTEMKIDKVFIQKAWSDTRSTAILRSSIGLAKDLGMEVVAEGGESEKDWVFCKTLGCDYFQGFYKSKPVQMNDLMNMLAQENNIQDNLALQSHQDYSATYSLT